MDRNALYYGDCYDVLTKHIPSESVDLVYLDPPFNSNRDYNVLFKEQTGAPAEAQVKAFTDTWKWSPDLYAEWDEFVDTCPNQPLISLMQSFIQYLKRNDVTAYLARMTPRLYELHRVLKPTGSLYLHCDPSASHYLKIILDLIFGPTSYANEISWKRSSAHSDTKQGMKRCGKIHDVIFFYNKSANFIWNPVYTPYDQEYLDSEYRHSLNGRRYKETDLTAAKPGGDTSFEWHVKRRAGSRDRWVADLMDEYLRPVAGIEYQAVVPYDGRLWAYSKENLIAFWKAGKIIHRETGMPRLMHFADEMPGVSLQDLWTDIRPALGEEFLPYPTQKPVALLKRILEASSNPGDVVLDPFCGCGTTVMAAQELGRKWIGIDITATATSLIEARLFDSFGIHNGKRGDYDILGLPTTEAEAIELANRDKHEFQKWAISLVPRAMPWQEKKGADGGVDGFVRFRFQPIKKETDLVIISVKGGQNLKMDDVKNLEATMKANKAALGFLISLVPATKGIIDWAQKVGTVKSPEGGTPVPAIQTRTVGQLLRGEAFTFPWNSTIHGIPKAGEGQGKLEV